MKKNILTLFLLSLFLCGMSVCNSIYAADISSLLTQLSGDQQASSTPTLSPNPTGQPSPTVNITHSPTATPILSISIGVTDATPSASISATIEPTEKPKPTDSHNVGGTDIISPAVSPEISPTPTSMPTVTPTPIVAPIPVENTQPPVSKVAEQIYKRLVVPPLSFLFQRPVEDFYTDNKIAKSTSYILSALAGISFFGGLIFLFPDKAFALYNGLKNKVPKLISPDFMYKPNNI